MGRRLGLGRRTGILAATAVTAVAAAACVPLLHEHGDDDGDNGRDPDKIGLSAFLAEHPGLRARQQPLAYIIEKLGDGGEGSREVVNGPAQEQYENRAFPRAVIADQQVQQSRSAFSAAGTRRGQKSAAAPGASPAAVLASGWTELGPFNPLVPGPVTYPGTPSIVAGRATALAVGRTCSPGNCTVYVGAAGGGVWRTSDALAARPAWTPIGQDIPSTAIGSLYVDPTDRTGRTLYVGTGEPNGSTDSEAGLGLYKSTNGGNSFSLVRGSAVVAKDRSVASVLVDPVNPRHIWIGTAVARHGHSAVYGGRLTPPGAPPIGIYESRDGGTTFTPAFLATSDVVDPTVPGGGDYFRGGVTSLQVDPVRPTTVYASVNAYGLFRKVGTGPWARIFTDPLPSSLDSRTEYAVTVKNGRTRIYLGNATSIKTTDNSTKPPTTTVSAALYRTDDAASLPAQSAAGNAANTGWTSLSSPTPGTPGYGSFNFCSTQCSYDQVVVSPPNRPDEVFIGGQMQYAEVGKQSNGRTVQRSADAGVHFTDMTNDARSATHGLHPDQHALVFLPTTSKNETFLSGSDGGVVRQSGPFVDRSNDCLSARRSLNGVNLVDYQQWLSAVPTANDELNGGLRTLQFQSLSVAPTKPGLLLGGTQDNGTWANDGRTAGSPWFESVGGDGGQSGFDARNADIRFHSYTGAQHDVNFRGSDPLGWDNISQPLVASGETASFYVPLRTDPVTPGRVFDGLQHVWRTDDNGGERAYLDQYCNEFTGTFPADKPCGDWKPMGGTTGDLTSQTWGTDRAGQYVVAVQRATSDRKTLWAATRTGRLFVSTNADSTDPAAVTYSRIDTSATPGRFVSGITVDPKNPNVAYISYSGYSAYSAGGHVYRAVYDPATRTASFSNLSFDLGDQPITDIALDRSTGDLYAGTDFGVVALASGTTTWVATSGLPPVAVYGLTLDPRSHVLYAATHGRGAWQFRLKD